MLMPFLILCVILSYILNILKEYICPEKLDNRASSLFGIRGDIYVILDGVFVIPDFVLAFAIFMAFLEASAVAGCCFHWNISFQSALSPSWLWIL